VAFLLRQGVYQVAMATHENVFGTLVICGEPRQDTPV
jgi:hypothetical protein